MLVASIQHVNFRYPKQTTDLLNDITFAVHSNSKLGLMGNNGSGKSTLLQLIKGDFSPDSGQIEWSHSCQVAYLPQQLPVSETDTIEDYCWSMQPELVQLRHQLATLGDDMSAEQAGLFDDFYQAGGYEFEAKLAEQLASFEFAPEDFTRKVKTLSGGEQTRLGLCALSLLQADLLLLDEPSNHLDHAMLVWLENYLQQLSIPFILISHDRQLLNQCVNEIVMLEKGTSQHFSGNYDFYLQQTAATQQRLQTAYEKQQKKIKQLQQAAVQREQWSKVKQKHSRSVTKTGRVCKRDDGSLPASKGRLTRQVAAVRERLTQELEKQKADKPFITKQRRLKGQDKLDISNQFILQVSNLSKKFDHKPLFTDLSFVVEQGSRFAIGGVNGAGKTSLLKILTEQLPADQGTVYWPPQVKYLYYDQMALNLNATSTALEHCLLFNRDQTLIRTTLGQLFFPAESINTPINLLSKGERAKVALACLLLQPSNVLILDEPCNHLELSAREALEEMLQQYQGTIIFVSHDRHFHVRLATESLNL